MNPNTESLLSVHALAIRFRRRRGWIHAVQDVNFNIARGTTLALVGESGCGKTSIGRGVLRLIEPQRGSVRLTGTDVLTARPATLRALRRDMQMIFQDASDSLNPRLPVGRIVVEPLEIQRKIRGKTQRRRHAEELLRCVGLAGADADRYPHELSGGQRQRVGIARALALKPKLVVCDEPVSALDISIQAQILNLLARLQKNFGLTYLFISHDLAVVRHIADQVAVMYMGRLVEIAETENLFTNPQHPYTIALLASATGATGPSRHHPRPPVACDEPPTPFETPPGCAFHPRCPFATEQCRQTRPQLETHPALPPKHRTACHHTSERTHVG